MSKSAKSVELANKVEALEKLINELIVSTKSSKSSKDDKKETKEKKPRNVTDKGFAHKAKLIFYQEMKETEEVKQAVCKKLSNEDTEITFKNWRQTKAITDEMYEKLSKSDMDKYIEKAKTAMKSGTTDEASEESTP
jgi:hypothetical protein